jgi:polysaccharide pyruvyl transferase WcaK-like protein
MHGVLMSLMMRKPVLAVSPARKVDHVMEEMGLSEYCIPVGSMETAGAMDLLRTLLSEKESLSEQIDRRAAVFAERLEEQYRRLFEMVEESRKRGWKIGQAPEA